MAGLIGMDQPHPRIIITLLPADRSMDYHLWTLDHPLPAPPPRTPLRSVYGSWAKAIKAVSFIVSDERSLLNLRWGP